MNKLLVSAILLLTVANASDFKPCVSEKATIFKCTTKKDKTIQLCDDVKTIRYSFGKANLKPEMELILPRDQITTHQWDGMGDFYYTVNIPNKNFLYRVFWLAERNTNDHAIKAGVEVEKSGSIIATIECRGEIPNTLEGLDLRPEQY